MQQQAPHVPSPSGRPRPTKGSPFRTLVYLFVFTGVLLLFIAWLGDWRRRHNIDTLMTKQMQDYVKLTSDGGTLPLNLTPTLPLDPPSRLIESWLTPDEARILRTAEQEVMVAWTIPLVRALGPNERAVIFFHKGAFELRWMPLKDFDALHARQVAETKRRAGV